MVTKLDRPARSVTHPGNIIAGLEAKGVAVRIDNLGVAQFEREMMLERQREGIANAKGEGPSMAAAVAAKLGVGKGAVYQALSEAPKAA